MAVGEVSRPGGRHKYTGAHGHSPPQSTMYITTIVSLFVGVVAAVWPVPIRYSAGNTTVVLSSGFTIEFVGPSGSQDHGCDTSSKVWGAIQRTYDLLNDGFIPNMLYPFEEDFEPSIEEMTSAQILEKLTITQRYRTGHPPRRS